MALYNSLFRKFNLSISVLSFEDKKKFLIIFFFILLGVALEIVSFSSIIPVATILLSDQNSTITVIKEKYSINSQDLTTLVLIFFLFFLVFKNLYLFLLAKYQVKFVNKILKNLRIKIYNNYLNQSIQFLSQKNSATILQNVINYCNIYTNFFLASILNIVLEIFLFFFTICILFYFNFSVTLICTSILLFFSGIILFINKNSMSKYGEVGNTQSILFTKNIQQTFSAIKDIKILGKENFFRKKVESNIDLLNTVSYKSSIIGTYPRYLVETLVVFSLISFLIYKLNLDSKYAGEIISPTFILFVAASFRLLPSINKIFNFFNRIRFSIPSVKSLLSEIKKMEKNSYSISNKKKNSLKFEIVKKIKISNIKFGYSTNKNLCLDNLSLNIYSNKIIGITGKSGSGKSTLVDIIMGLKFPISGFVKINNHNLLDLNDNWRKIIGYVQQDVFLLDESIRSNIAFGVDQSKIDFKLINNLIKKIQLENFIKSLPDGLDTKVGERGTRISGGQKQRIAIIRALYHSPKILILDEATNGIDYESEILILKLLRKIKKNMIIIFISHKKSVLRFCDVVYQLKNKKLHKIKKYSFKKT